MSWTTKTICCTLAIVLVATVAPAAELQPGVRYLVKATTQVTISLPVGQTSGQSLYRNVDGKWLALPNAKQAQGTLTFTLSPAQLAGGATVVLVNKPDWLDPNDNTPPKIVKASVDGKPVKAGAVVALGWLDAAPKTFVLDVADAQNPLDPKSVYAEINGTRAAPDGKTLRFEPDPKDNKRGRIICTIPRDAQGTTHIVVGCDDFAADQAKCTTELSFTVTRTPKIELGKPDKTAPNGIKIYCDSICNGYENVDCMVDGKLMTPGVTTYGKTWASTETSTDHWMCFVFPKPRELSGIEISWANYKGIYWTSRRYDILTWDGKQWQRVLRVQGNKEAATSKHAFAPRTTDRVIVWSPEGGNHPQRPNIMWVTEVKFLP